MTPTDPTTLSLAALSAAVRELRIHDVSPTLGPQTPMFFAHPAPRVTPMTDHATHGVATNVLEVHEHAGTHVDAPFHFDPNGLTIDAVPAEALFLRPFKKFDVSIDDPQPGEPVEVGQLIAAAERAGIVLEDGDVAIVEFGWDRYLPGRPDAPDPSWWGSNQPGLSEAACDYLATAGISAVASDTPACDVSVRDGEMVAGFGHSTYFLPNGILIVEGLCGLAAVPTTGLLAALPLKVAGGTGSPLRVLLLTS